jgi:hypothetical protein
VLVIVTVAAFTGVLDAADDGVDDVAVELDVTVMQSPVATEERLAFVIAVKRVEDAQATVVVPELVATFTPEVPISVAFPDAVVKLASPARALGPVVAAGVAPPPAVPPAAVLPPLLLLDPQAVRATAVMASPATDSSRAWVWRR